MLLVLGHDDVVDDADRDAAELDRRAVLEPVHRLVEERVRDVVGALQLVHADPRQTEDRRGAAGDDEQPELPAIGGPAHVVLVGACRRKKACTRASTECSASSRGAPRAMMPPAARSSMMHWSATCRMLVSSCVTSTIVTASVRASVKIRSS